MEIWADYLMGADIAFTVILVISLLVMLYAMTLMSRAIRLLQYQVSAIENDLRLIGEEIKMMSGPGGDEPRAAQSVEDL